MAKKKRLLGQKLCKMATNPWGFWTKGKKLGVKLRHMVTLILDYHDRQTFEKKYIRFGMLEMQ